MARAIPLNWFLIGGIGVLYLLYAKTRGLPPFNPGGAAETYLPDFFGPGKGLNTSPPAAGGGDIPMGAGGGGVSLPPPLDPARMTPQQMMAGRDIYGNPVKPGTNPFEAPMAPGMIDLGSGYQMANPNGTPPAFGSGASRATQFQSTVANDPTPTDYGIYTQYLNGLRNEYLSMEEQRRVANAQDIGIGGDITTLPAPPVVGATPFNYPNPQVMTPYGHPRPPTGFPGAPPPPPHMMMMGYQQEPRGIRIGKDGISINLGGGGGRPSMIGYGAPAYPYPPPPPPPPYYPGQPTGYTMNRPGSMVPGMSSGFPQAYPGQYNYPPPYAQGPVLYPPGPRAYATRVIRHPRRRNRLIRIEKLEDRLNKMRNRIEDRVDRWEDRVDRIRERAQAYPATPLPPFPDFPQRPDNLPESMNPMWNQAEERYKKAMANYPQRGAPGIPPNFPDINIPDINIPPMPPTPANANTIPPFPPRPENLPENMNPMWNQAQERYNTAMDRASSAIKNIPPPGTPPPTPPNFPDQFPFSDNNIPPWASIPRPMRPDIGFPKRPDGIPEEMVPMWDRMENRVNRIRDRYDTIATQKQAMVDRMNARFPDAQDRIQRLEERFATDIAGTKQDHIDRMRERMSKVPFPPNAVMGNGGPADLTGIKPTLFNAVSRNQPGGLRGQRVGNVK